MRYMLKKPTTPRVCFGWRPLFCKSKLFYKPRFGSVYKQNYREMNMNFKELFHGKTDSTKIQFFRYAFVGGISFIVDFCLLAFFTEVFSVHYLVSAALAFIGGLTTNYLLSIGWVFRVRKNSSRKTEFLVFFVTGIIGLGLNQLFIWSFTEWLGIYYLVSKVLSTLLVLVWNFSSRKFILFREMKSP